MQESREDIAQLQALLSRSIEQAGSFLRESFQMPVHSLSAEQLAGYLQGMRTLALATVTTKGEPRVAPIGALFYRGHFYIPTTRAAARTKQILRNPAISLTLFENNGFALIAHGHAELVAPGNADFTQLEDLQHEYTGSRVSAWGEGIFLRIISHTLYTYVREPERF